MIKSTEFLALFSNIKILSMNLVANKVKHVLSHRHLFTNLYKVEVDQDNKIIPDNILIPISELDRYPTSKLIHSLLEKYM